MTEMEYRLAEGHADLDLDRVVQWLARESYWALGRERDVIERSFAASWPAGIYARAGQVAVARIVSDGVTFAWLCDVFVDADHRGRGLGRRLARWATDWADQRGVQRIVLATRDAHDVYASAGFEALAAPRLWMEIDRRPQRAASRLGPTGSGPP